MRRKLITADLHLDDSTSTEYRFGIFESLAHSSYNRTSDIYILGDLVDKKDRHRGVFLNKVKSHIEWLVENMDPRGHLYILLGNHDVAPGSEPPFAFLDSIHDRVHYVTKLDFVENNRVALLPYCQFSEDYYEGWWDSIYDLYNSYGLDLMLTHNTFDGSQVSNGQVIRGEQIPDINVPIISGDVHPPQSIQNVTYAGSPYPVKFGDHFEPRMLLVDEWGGFHNIPVTDTPKRLSIKANRIEDAEQQLLDHEVKPGDQTKVQLTIDTSEVSYWSDYREKIQNLCSHYGVELHGVEVVEGTRSEPLEECKNSVRLTYRDYFDEYCKQEGVDQETYDVGAEVLNLEDGSDQ